MLVINILLVYNRDIILKTHGGVHMNKVFQVIAAAVVSVAFFGTSASAQTPAPGCQSFIYGTGQGSNNTIDCTTVSNVTLTCDNNITVANINYQNGQTGPATVGGNTSGGAAVTGTVTNTNGAVLNIGAACGTPATPAASTSPSPSASTTPGMGSVTPKALPNTASNSTASIIAASLVAAAAVVVASRLAVAAYRRIGTK